MKIPSQPLSESRSSAPQPADWDDLQSRWDIQEYTFRSTVPVVGPLIVAVRRFWNNMSARWYTGYMFEQQSAFNQLVVQRLEYLQKREDLSLILAEYESQLSALQIRLDELEQALFSLKQEVQALGAQSKQMQSVQEEQQAEYGRLQDELVYIDQEAAETARRSAEVAYVLVQMRRQAAKQETSVGPQL